MIFLGLASNYSARDIWRHSFTLGSRRDYRRLELALASRYGATLANTSLVFSGRTAIYLALQSFIESGRLKPGDHVALNAFTCHAVVEAIRRAKLTPVFVDLAPRSPDYSAAALAEKCQQDKRLHAFILQNTFGNPVDIAAFEAVKRQYGLLLLEDLAHCAGRHYPDGREIGTVGEAVCLSFGKGKAIDTIHGGAVLLRDPTLRLPKTFDKSAFCRKQHTGGDPPRASWYPLFGAIARGLAHLHLEKPWLWLLLKLHWIERSADTKLRTDKTITVWQAKLALRQLAHLPDKPLREYYLIDHRDECLKHLRQKGYRLEEFWYEVPVAPTRYYTDVHFPEKDCKNAVFFAAHVINLPTWYHDKKHQKQIADARKLIKTYEVR